MKNFILNNKSNYLEKHLNKIESGNSLSFCGVTNIAKLFFLAKIFYKFHKKIFFITDTEQNANRYRNDMSALFNISSDIFPYQETSFYDLCKRNIYRYSSQTEKILNKKDTDFLIVPVKSLFEKFPCKDFIEKNSVTIKVDTEIDVEDLIKKLVKSGYKRRTMVVDTGEFSVRGDIIDIFSLDELPYRIELWGDNVTDIRKFDNVTQKSVEKLQEITILPIQKFILDDKNVEIFKKTYEDEIKNLKNDDEVLQDLYCDIFSKLELKDYFEGIEYFEELFNPKLMPLTSFFEEYIFVFDDYTLFKSKYEQLDEIYQKQYGENLSSQMILPLKSLKHDDLKTFLLNISSKQKIYFDNFMNDEITNIQTELHTNLVPDFSSKISDITDFIKGMIKGGYKVFIATDYKLRVAEFLKEYELAISDNFSDITSISFLNSVSLSGSILNDMKIVIITDKELFNKRSKDITSSQKSYRRETADFIESVNDIKSGDYVVHIIHGIGIFLGLFKQEIDGEQKDYLTIEYANKDKLHIPAEQINMLCRYRGSGNVKPSLSKMGGNDWNNTKTKVKKAVEDIAQDLINLYAVRKMADGYSFEPDTVWQYEMEDAFEYTETKDQMKAIFETKSDMESNKPMDRLICGDVGFGKTEIAIRAIFKAVMSSKQVAVIVPTTILAMQHYQTISERFKPFPVKVELISRFKSKKEQNNTVKNLILGECDVVIGTHRLLQNDIMFKDLGLLVIDEEHKFGVKDKEKLKMLKKNVDILTMSATPIPRTFYMSLSGIKDMSVINTPPVNRLPIKTYTGEFKENIVRNAINHELDRDGQVFYLYNKVESIYDFAITLQKIVPNARIAIAHGQMDKTLLEKVMLGFLEKEYDILLCTTIIESGLDIPNANTIIIHDADKFGLAQLYQIRGRVGRTDRQAFCYCLVKNINHLTDDAVKRLKYIREFTTLGSGYRIALRDIEIRGVGNILGTKQHGQMVNVGFDTYCALLEEAINELKTGTVKHSEPTIVDINITAYIPDEWAGSKEQKMIEYKRLADVKSLSELDIIVSEWKDRFSKMSEPVENLIKLIRLRLLANRIHITLIRETGENIRIYTNFTLKEWQIICLKVPKNLTKYIKYTKAPETCKEGKSILLLNNSHLSFEELFSILTNLFYNIDNIISEYENKC